jgi:hypothetical protein
MNDKQLAIQTSPTLAAFDTKSIEDTLRAALPNGQRLTSDQIRAAAIAAQTTDLNPIVGELHITNTGIMGAAKVAQAKANEFLQTNGDFAEWSYQNIGSMSADEMRARLADLGRSTKGDFNEIVNELYKALDYNPSADHAVYTKLYLRKSNAEWRHNVEMALALGATPEEVRREYGIRPRPDYAAWGIVRFKEQKSDPKGKSAQEKWDEMNMKYSPLERAKKRGRTACINALLPVTTDQRRRFGFTQKGEDIVISRLADQPQVKQNFKFDIVDHPEPAGPSAADIVDTTTSELDDEPPFDVDEPDTTPRNVPQSPVASIPPRIDQLFNRLSAKRAMYEEKGWLNSEKQDGFLMGVLRRMCGKDDGLYKTMLKLLTAQEHWGDVPPGRRRAILKDWLKLDASGSPCAEAQADFEEIRKYHISQNTSQGK